MSSLRERSLKNGESNKNVLGVRKMKIAYPAIIKKYEIDYLVYIPDFDGYTQGTSIADAIEMARDAIGMNALTYLDLEKPLPEVSSASDAYEKAVAVRDRGIDFDGGFCSYVDLDVDAYRAKIRGRSVKKNCTIPAWLNEKAEKKGVNFSKVLQDALIAYVGD